MKTRRSLKPNEPLLVGRLVLIREPRSVGARRMPKPVLLIKVWCPYCKGTHSHGFVGAPSRQDEVSHRIASCHKPESPFREAGYWIGLDPESKDHNRKVIEEYTPLAEAFATATGGLDLLTTEELFAMNAS